MKDIVIVANFVGGLQKKDNNRFPYLAELLSEKAQVELIASDFEHAKKAKRNVDATIFPFHLTLLSEPGYPKNICLQRFKSHAVFGRNVLQYLRNRRKPDVVYCACPSLDAAWAAAKYCRETGTRFVVDIQDLWPEAFKMVFRMPVVSDLIFSPMNRTANRIYAQADDIVAVSNSYCQRALQVNKKASQTHTVFLGTQLSDFDRNAASHAVQRETEDLLLGYCGTLGSSYDLTCVFDALVLLRKQGVPLPQFLIMGDGPKRAAFEAYAAENNLPVHFAGRLPYDEMCGLLCTCDIVVNPITAGSAASIINKHADYASSGKPVVNTQESPEYRKLVEDYNMGFNCRNGDAKDLAEKLNTLLQDASLRKTLGSNARRCAEEKFDRATSYGEIISFLLQ